MRSSDASPLSPLKSQLLRDTRRSLFVYNLLFPFVFAALLPGFLLRMFRRGGFRAKFGQRVGLYTDLDRAPFQRGEWIWIHSISVGETLVALKLARELYRHDRSVRVVISVTTSTGFAIAREATEDWIEVIYNPIDLRSIIREAIETIRPVHLVLIEGEVWPNLVAECCRRNIPLTLVNARLSPRSEARFRRFRVWTGPFFRLLDTICVSEPEDIDRWQSIGIDPARIRHTGSIKFDDAGTAIVSRANEFRNLLRPLGVDEATPILVGGSTWAPEEKLLAELLIALRRELPTLFLILVPRHIERSADILRELSSLKLRVVRRTALETFSRSETPNSSAAPADLLLVDTTGELRDWYQLGTVVFVGKSMPGIADIGGQNPAEPAALGKPVVFGPHMENFAAVVRLLLAHSAAVQVDDATGLAAELRNLLTDSPRRETIGTRACAALEIHRSATNRIALLLLAGT